MKLNSQAPGDRRKVIAWVVTIWGVLVAMYVVGGLRPHGFIESGAEALLTWLGWMMGGGLLLAWVAWQYWSDTAFRSGPHPVTGMPWRANSANADIEQEDRLGDTEGRDECGLRMGPAGFGFYRGSLKTDDD